MAQEPWREEFGDDYAVPEWFTKNLYDESSRNDSAPRFTYGEDLASDPYYPDDEGRWIVVWVEHPDKSQRILGRDWPRYVVQVWGGVPGTTGDVVFEIPTLETEDLAQAVKYVQQRARELGIPEPPGLSAGSRDDVAKALDEINRDRRQHGRRPLDPAAAGWTDEDILKEAKRIRSPNPLKQRLLQA